MRQESSKRSAMADKDIGRYRYEQYPPITSKPNNSQNSNSLKRSDSASKASDSTKCCCCTISSRSASFWASFLTNLGICTLLFGYTLLGEFLIIQIKLFVKLKHNILPTGSFIFLAIEGGASQMQQRTLASTNRQTKPLPSNANNNLAVSNITLSNAAIQDTIEARQRTVENIWDITVSLNILYRENWTR